MIKNTGQPDGIRSPPSSRVPLLHWSKLRIGHLKLNANISDRVENGIVRCVMVIRDNEEAVMVSFKTFECSFILRTC